MHPAYGYIDPYHQAFPIPKDHNPYSYHHYPIWEAVPPHMKLDSARPPSFGPWASNSSSNHSFPTDHHHCCNYSYPPGYYSLRPPYSHIQPPPQLYYHGPNPPYTDFCPAYFVPPPHYSADQSLYDYDKAKEHCCGCPNHVCHPKNTRGTTSLKIEEQKPEEEQNEGHSIRQQNYPYPFFWSPRDSKESNVSNNKSELPSSWNGWFPLDLNSLKGMMQQGSDNENKSHNVFKINADPNGTEEFPPKYKIIPLKLLENENHVERPGVAEDEPMNQVQPESSQKSESNSNSNPKTKTRTIPVKQMEEANVAEPTLPEKEKKLTTPEPRDNQVKKASDSKAASPKRPSKLPPVCLRVDPLPRKKAGNGNSRSSNPPGVKEGGAHRENKEQEPKDMKERVQKKETKVVKVSDAANDSLKQEAVPVVSLENTAGKNVAEKAGKDEGRQMAGDVLSGSEIKEAEEGVAKDELKVEKEGKMRALEDERRRERKESRRNLSQLEAAVLIQSVYRGFEVRRWQPLEKLRKIARIREQAADIRRHIESLQASSKELDSKQSVVISEAIMNLLLQLDTIQGLHPSVREIRKAVARYLITLQEKLDSLGSQATTDEPAQIVEDSTKKSSSDVSANSLSSTLATEQVLEKVAQPLEQDGLTESSFELERETECDKKQDAETVSGNGESVETPAMSLESFPLSSSNDEEQKEAPLVSKGSSGCEDIEKPCTTEGSAQSSDSQGEKMSSTEVVQSLGVQEIPKSQEVNCQGSTTVEEEIFDAGTEHDRKVDLGQGRYSEIPGISLEDELKQEDKLPVSSLELVSKPEGKDVEEVAMEDEVSNAAMKDDISDTTIFSETSLQKEYSQEDELPVPPPQFVSKSGAVVEDAKEVAIEGDVVIEYDSKVGVDQRKSLGTSEAQESNLEKKLSLASLEDNNKLEEEAIVTKADDTEIGSNMEVSAELLAGEGKPDMKHEHPLLPMEEEDHVNKTLAFSGVDNSRGLEVSLSEQMQYNVAAKETVADSSVGNNPLQAKVENAPSRVIECCGEDGQSEDAANEGIEFIDAGAVLESAANEASSPISNGVPEASDITPAYETDTSELNGEDASAHILKSASEGVSTLELSSKENKLVEENEKLRKMLEKLLEAGKQQLGVISNLNGRVKDLEKRLTQKKKVRVRRNKIVR